MNTILQKRIEEKSKGLAQKYFPNEMNIWARPNYEAQYVVSACKEIATFALQNQWISVEEALPQDNKVVFYKALSEKGTKCYGSAYVFNKEWYNDIDSAAQNYYHYKITHWMPIPSSEGGEE